MKTKIVLLAALLSVTATFAQKKWTLKECVDYALKNNITIKQNQLNVQLAEKDVDIAKGNFLPDLNGSSGANVGFGSTIHPVSQNRISQNTFGNSYSLNTGVSIFNGFRNLNSLKQAKLSVEGSKMDLAKMDLAKMDGPGSGGSNHGAHGLVYGSEAWTVGLAGLDG